MQRQFAAAVVVGVTTGWTGLAVAGPCGDDVAKFEQTVRASGKNPVAGPTAPQTVGAQLNHQPTQESVKAANEAAWAQFNALLTRARSLDAANDGPGCTKTLGDARKMFETQ